MVPKSPLQAACGSDNGFSPFVESSGHAPCALIHGCIANAMNGYLHFLTLRMLPMSVSKSMRLLRYPLVLLIAATCLPLAADETLRVMSFNLRFGSANDGDNHWDKRKQNLVTTIAQFDPDLLGTQETLQFQADYIAEHLSQFTYFGRSRMKTPNEHCGIFYKTERFTWLAGGHFWLSETPEVAESKSWDSSLPRMASWVLLSDNRQEMAQPILFVNSHFDHRGGEARQKSAELIRQRIANLSSIANDPRVIVTGDFNTPAESAPYQAFLEGNDQLVDIYRVLHPDRADEDGAGEGTFNAFQGKTNGPRIDWILASPTFKILSAEIERRSFDGRYPSDHFPVTAVLTTHTR